MPKTSNIPELSDNLKPGCCVRTVELEVCPNDPSKIVLWDRIADACAGNNNKSCYSLTIIVDLNKEYNRPTGIVCRNCDNGVCVLSLRINGRQHTRFARI
jgi:hypothetical protein